MSDAAALRIVFMGTPDFSVPTLDVLHRSRHHVLAVVSQPDRPKGRGRKLEQPPVKARALELGYPVFQPERVREPEFMAAMTALAPDVLVVVAFGHILHQPFLDLPTLAPINIHASLLPKYRGSAPIQWAVIHGEKETGVATMFMDRGMDTGDILLTARTSIGPADTAASLHDRLSLLGADLLSTTLDGLIDGSVVRVPQDHAAATYAPLLKKDDGFLDWEKPAHALECQIRGMFPWPGTFTFYAGRRLKVFKARALDMDTSQPPGTVIQGFPNEIWVACGTGVLAIQEIQSASGKRMDVECFLRGCCIDPGERMELQPACECES